MQHSENNNNSVFCDKIQNNSNFDNSTRGTTPLRDIEASPRANLIGAHVQE